MATHKHLRFYKKFIKLLAHSPNNKLTSSLLKLAPIQVIKLISNAGIIASHGTHIRIPNKQKSQFKKHRKLFSVLQDRSVGFDKKGKYLIQKGNAAFIPILLSTVLPIVSDLLFRAFSNK